MTRSNKTKGMKKSFTVTIELEEGYASVRGITNHIREAVECWGGQYHPDDILFSANVKKVTVKPIATQKASSKLSNWYKT